MNISAYFILKVPIIYIPSKGAPIIYIPSKGAYYLYSF